MSLENRLRFSKGLHMGFLIAGIVGLATMVMAWFQWHAEKHIDRDDLDRRARLLAYQLKDTVQDALRQPDKEASTALANQLDGHSRLIGFAVYRPDGRKLTSGKGLAQYMEEIDPVVARAISEKSETIETIRSHDTVVHILATRLTDDQGATQGVIVALHDVAHLEERDTARMIRYAFWVLVVTFILFVLVAGITWIPAAARSGRDGLPLGRRD